MKIKEENKFNEVWEEFNRVLSTEEIQDVNTIVDKET